MSITQVLINNLTTGPLSLDIKLDPKRVIRNRLGAAGTATASVNVASVATLDELNRNAEVQRLRGISPAGAAKISVTTEAASGDDDIDALESGPIWRRTIAADSTLAADVIGAATETIHTALTIPASVLARARRTIAFRARLHVVASNAADTWTFRARLGGLTGAVLVASAAIDIANNDVYEISGTIELRTLGAAGTFDSVTTFLDVVNDTGDVDTAVLAGAIDTTGSVTLVITGTCSSNNAGNQVSLRHFSAEARAA